MLGYINRKRLSTDRSNRVLQISCRIKVVSIYKFAWNCENLNGIQGRVINLNRNLEMVLYDKRLKTLNKLYMKMRRYKGMLIIQ